MGKYLDGIQVALVVIATAITLYFQFTQDRSIQSVALFGVLIILVVVYFAYSYVRDRFAQIDALLTKIKTIEDKVDYMKDIGDLKTRVAVIEEQLRRRGKGSIDPRWMIGLI